MKKKSKRIAYALILGIVLMFLSYQELSSIEDAGINTEIEKIMVYIERYNPQMSNSLRFQAAQEIYRTASRDHNLTIPLLCALITHESARTWNPEIISPAGAVGLMQILPSTARQVLVFSFSDQERDERSKDLSSIVLQKILSDPVMNIRIGSRYLSYLIDRNGLMQGLIAYYMGESKMKILEEVMGERFYSEVELYLASIFELSEDIS
jgi:soluble lytic murein transglycosylase-like protein